VLALCAIPITISLTGPEDIDLATIAPGAVENTTALSYSARSIEASPSGSGPIVITYFLDDISERIPPEGNYWGHFTGLSMTVTGPGTFTLNASPASQTIVLTDSRPRQLSLSIPPFAKTVALVAVLPSENSTARWEEVQLHRVGLWPVITLLLLIVAGTFALTTSLARRVVGRPALTQWAPAVMNLALAAAVLVQSADALSTRAFSLWFVALHQTAKFLLRI
jgi:hypothetical protein